MFLDCSGGPIQPHESFKGEENDRKVGQKDTTIKEEAEKVAACSGLHPPLLAMKMKEGTTSQGIQVASRH